MPCYAIYAAQDESQVNEEEINDWQIQYDDAIFQSLLCLSKSNLLDLLSISESENGLVEHPTVTKVVGRQLEIEPSTLEIYMALQVRGFMDCYPKFVSQFGT